MEEYGVCRRHKKSGPEEYLLPDRTWGTNVSQSLKTDETTAKSMVRSFAAAEAAKKMDSLFSFDDFMHPETEEK